MSKIFVAAFVVELQRGEKDQTMFHIQEVSSNNEILYAFDFEG